MYILQLQSSALICGWYTSQLLCMRRRHLQNGWNGGCKYANIFMQPSQAFHSTVLSHWAKAAPDQEHNPYIWKYNEGNKKFRNDADFHKESIVKPVSYDHLKNVDNISTDAKVSDLRQSLFESAFHAMIKVLK